MVRLLLAAALLATVPLAAASEPPPAAAFGERLAIDLIEVEVFVTDRDGRVVRGLEAADFALEVDGRPVEIVGFVAPSPAPAPARAEASAAPAHTAAPQPAAARSSDPLHLVFYVDAENLSPQRRAAFAEAVREALSRDLPPGSRTLVAVQDHGLRVVQPFTTDPALAVAAVARLPAEAGTELERRVEARHAFQTIRDLRTAMPPPDYDFCYDAWDAAQSAALAHAESIAQTAARSLDGLGRLAGALAGLPGRKTIVYVGDGLERRPALDVYHYLDELCSYVAKTARPMSKAPAIDLTRAFQDVTARANAAGVTVYALQTLDLATAVASTRVETFKVTADDVRVMGAELSASVARLRHANLQSGLVGITEETGGRALFDTTRFAESLAEVVREVDDAYVLAFAPPTPPDGRDHWIEVSVADREARTVRHRTVYRAKPLEEQVEEQLYGSLLFGADANPLVARLAFGAAAPADEAGRVRLPVEVRVPLGELALLPAAGTDDAPREGLLRLVMTARDADGRWLPARQKLVPLRVEGAAGAADAAEHEFVIDIDLAPGEHLVAVAVRDETTGEVSYLRREVVAAAAPDGAAADGGEAAARR